MSVDSNHCEAQKSSKTPITFVEDPAPDILLRAVDHVEFRVHKALLALASPVFRDMFVVGKPIDSGCEEVELQENGVTLRKLLALCYPAEDPRFGGLNELSDVLEAVRKYQMGGVDRQLKVYMQQTGKQEPLRLYALACRFGMEEEAKFAALHTLRMPIVDSYAPELEQIPAGVYHRLLEYRQTCSSSNSAAAHNVGVWGSQYASEYFACDCNGGYQSFLTGRESIKDLLDRASASLQATPSADTLAALNVVPSALRAASCTQCSTRAPVLLPNLLSMLVSHVRKLNSDLAEKTRFI